MMEENEAASGKTSNREQTFQLACIEADRLYDGTVTILK